MYLHTNVDMHVCRINHAPTHTSARLLPTNCQSVPKYFSLATHIQTHAYVFKATHVQPRPKPSTAVAHQSAATWCAPRSASPTTVFVSPKNNHMKNTHELYHLSVTNSIEWRALRSARLTTVTWKKKKEKSVSRTESSKYHQLYLLSQLN